MIKIIALSFILIGLATLFVFYKKDKLYKKENYLSDMASIVIMLGVGFYLLCRF